MPDPARPATPEPPPLPRLNLSRVLADRGDLYRALRQPFHSGDPIDQAGFAAMVAEAMTVLGPRGVDVAVLAESCACLRGTRMVDHDLWLLAWRLAANLPRLKAGKAVYPWTCQREDEWVPFHVASACLASRGGRKGPARPGAMFTFKALAGSYAGGEAKRHWSREQCHFVAREIGFPGFGKGVLEHPYQLVGMRLFGLFTVELSGGGRPDFKRVAASGSMVDRNRRIIRRRTRDEPCPFSYAHACHRCAVGYQGKDGESGCVAAVHPAPYEARPCPDCGEAEAAFDTNLSEERCLLCLEKKALAGIR